MVEVLPQEPFRRLGVTPANRVEEPLVLLMRRRPPLSGELLDPELHDHAVEDLLQCRGQQGIARTRRKTQVQLLVVQKAIAVRRIEAGSVRVDGVGNIPQIITGHPGDAQDQREAFQCLTHFDEMLRFFRGHFGYKVATVRSVEDEAFLAQSRQGLPEWRQAHFELFGDGQEANPFARLQVVADQETPQLPVHPVTEV
jgi:hypothetical protein